MTDTLEELSELADCIEWRHERREAGEAALKRVIASLTATTHSAPDVPCTNVSGIDAKTDAIIRTIQRWLEVLAPTYICGRRKDAIKVEQT